MANGDTKTEAMLNVLGNGGSGDEFRGCCNTKTQQYILDAIDRINNIDPSGGGGDVEYVDLTLTGTSPQGLTVTASKYMDEVLELAEDDKRVIFRITLPSGTGYPTSGTYELPMFNYEDNEKMLAMTVVALGDTLYSIIFGYDLSGIVGDHTNAGIIAIDVVPTGGSGPTVVQTTGTSTTDVMSQDATTKMITQDATNQNSVSIISTSNGYQTIAIGKNARAYQPNSIAIGSGTSTNNSADVTSTYGIAIGSSSHVRSNYGIAIGYNTSAQEESVSLGHSAGVGNSNNSSAKNNVYLGHDAGSATHTYSESVALGHSAQFTRSGEVNIGAGNTTNGYNSTSYRVLGGVHDPVDAHDAATKGYVDAHSGGGSSAIKVLTSADRNWDSTGQGGEPNAIAAWLLDDGWYKVGDLTYTSGGVDNVADVFYTSDNVPSGNLLIEGCIFQVGAYGTIIFALDGSDNVKGNGILTANIDPADGSLTEGEPEPGGGYSPYLLSASMFYWALDELWKCVPMSDSGVPDSSLVGTLGQFYTDIDTMHTYQCTAIDDSDPDEENWLYTWTQRW